ncbi:hypothetical protein NL676_017374 [Syzygium grande]|nr:hypothetical protein NL676_017374 [Syzygium grande]
MAHEAKEKEYAESGTSQQIFLSELQQRDALIEHFQKTSNDEKVKKEMEIYRLECEPYMMANLPDGYKKAWKETDRKFAEYRACCSQLDEPQLKMELLQQNSVDKSLLRTSFEDGSSYARSTPVTMAKWNVSGPT